MHSFIRRKALTLVPCRTPFPLCHCANIVSGYGISSPSIVLSFQSFIIHPPYNGPCPHTQLSVPLLSRWLFLAAVLLFWNLLLTGCCWLSGRRSLLECLAYSQTTPESQRRMDGSGLWLQLSACCSERRQHFSVLYDWSTFMYHWPFVCVFLWVCFYLFIHYVAGIKETVTSEWFFTYKLIKNSSTFWETYITSRKTGFSLLPTHS